MAKDVDAAKRWLEEQYARQRKDGLSHDDALEAVYGQARSEVEKFYADDDYESSIGGTFTVAAVDRLINKNWEPPTDLEQKWDSTKGAEGAGERAEEAFAGITVPGMGQGPVGLPGGDLTNPLARRGGTSQQQTDPMAALRAQPIVMSDEELSRYLVDPNLGQISEADPESMASMQRALDAMEGTYQAGPGGFLEGQRQAVDQRIRQQRQAALSTLQQRGQYGGGAELAMLLGSGQDAAQSKAAVDSDAMRVAMDAMTTGYNMAGGIHDARQRIADFNSGIVRQNTMLNQSLRHQQALDRLGEQRSAQSYNRELPWRQFGGQLQLGTARSGAATGQAGLAMQQAGLAQQSEMMRQQMEAQARAQQQASNAQLWNLGLGALQAGATAMTGPVGGMAVGALGKGAQGLLTEDQVF